ncbi:hypothetical protein K450DRAFT_245251 [Umbelopsis ramanniana AG]|uniref:Inositol-tetrakisphosphate 1-kinase n=1 Tax=Umbelopsis ramanniana AG TaxID=1314678 RepID=A0AAD5HC59_UMBRA|nr:uncharacterized protein K450DRAFT_245251 [Umbelopsis ramanniana AG]KAI8578732.1 hypothetical protein K450DRAFT_245251 [Umbelopsis ramanniana AG]
MTCQPVKTVGLIFSKKKIQRSGFVGLPEYASQHGLRIVHVDLDDPMAMKINFDLIVHKLTDLIAAATKGQVDAKRQLDNFEQYTKSHPKTIILDPLVHVDQLMDRRNTFEVLKACLTAHTHDHPDATEPLFYLPNHICLPNIHATFSTQNLPFPILCKRVSACSSEEAHKMTLVPNPQHIHLLGPYYDKNEPVIFQEFIQHDGVIFKVYVVDGTSFVQVRPSFKNVTLEDDLLHFDSQIVPKAFEQDTPLNSNQQNGTHHQHDSILQAFLTRDTNNMRIQKEAVFDHRKIELITQRLFEQLELTFFGYDILVETGPKHRHFVVDVNYFPSFNNIPDFRERFVDIILSRLKNVE